MNVKHTLEVMFYLRKKSVDGLFVTQRNILEMVPVDRARLSSILKVLEGNRWINVEMVHNNRNTGSRKQYKLNDKGLLHTDKIIMKAMKEDERKIFDLYHMTHNIESNKIQRDFSTIINLFFEYGFNDNASLFSEMVRNFVTSVKKFFKYETQFTQVLAAEQKSDNYH